MEKLVRDLIPDIIKGSGKKPKFKKATSDHEFKKLLKLKIVEEAQELLWADEKTELEEIADISEIIYSLLGVMNKTVHDLDEAIKSKLFEKGGFKQRFILETR